MIDKDWTEKVWNKGGAEMSKWRIDWTSYDCGYEIIDAETRDEALEKFRDIQFEELLHGREPYGEITRVTEEKEAQI